MLRSVHSPWDAQEDFRSLRSHVPRHTRFLSESEFSDSPSVYSHAYFSPDSRDIEPDTSSYHYDPDSSSQRRPSISNSDYLDDHAASSLDLDDEDITGVSINTADTTDATENDDEDDEDDDASHRISVQGPKIRFHSRAPWETGEEDTVDENDSDHSAMSTAFGKKVKSKAAKVDLIRHFGKSSSTRPSAESTRSQIQSNGSFEIIAGNHSSSRGTLYTLAQESFSSSSLTVPSQQFPAPSLRNRHNFSLPRTTNYPPTTHYDDHTPEEPLSATSSLRELGHIPQPSSSTQDTPRPYSPASEVPRDHERSSTVSSFYTFQCHEDFIHPYANPDLVASYTPPRPAQPRSTFGHISRSDSAATVTDSLSSRSGAFSSTITPDTSASSIPSRDPIPSAGMRVHGKDISPPITVLHSNDLNTAQCDQSTNLPTFHRPSVFEGVPGWNGHSSPTVTLISLQEAQARERTRSATANAMALSPSRVDETTSHAPFPEPDDSASIASTETSAAGNFKRVRARSTSAGARAKGVLHSVVAASLHSKPERRGSEPDVVNPSGQTLRHKKSGFMRLFNGREREKGRDKGRSPPPPVPSLHGVYPHGGNEDNKSSLPIIPPRLSSMGSDGGSRTALNESSDAEQELSPKASSPSLKRAPPSLYISTGASNHSPLSAEHRPTAQSPQSGKKTPWHPPLGPIDFQALKLRPVSTTFSSQFSDIVAIPEVEHTSELELDTPTSTNSSVAALSPFTPGWSRPSDDKSSPVEQSLVIKALQEQMVAAKKDWQRQIWELQGQVRDLQAEVEDFHAADEDKGYCEHCGRGGPRKERKDSNAGTKKIGVVDRPRGRTGDTTRFVSRN